MQEWLTAIDEQVNFILEQPPTLALSSDLAHLLLLKEKLPTIEQISVVDTDDHLEQLMAHFNAVICDYADSKRQSILRNEKADVGDFKAVLHRLSELIDVLRQGADVDEKNILKDWIANLYSKIK